MENSSLKYCPKAKKERKRKRKKESQKERKERKKVSGRSAYFRFARG